MERWRERRPPLAEICNKQKLHSFDTFIDVVVRNKIVPSRVVWYKGTYYERNSVLRGGGVCLKHCLGS